MSSPWGTIEQSGLRGCLRIGGSPRCHMRSLLVGRGSLRDSIVYSLWRPGACTDIR